MYAHGSSFRVHLPDGKRVNLGSDLPEAIRRYTILMAPKGSLDELPSAEKIWKRHRRGAAVRSIAFDLTVEDVAAALEKAGGRCSVTEHPFSMEWPSGMRVRPWSPSIDRIDATKGYHADNIRIVCAFVNIAMNGFGDAQFHLVLRRIIDAAVKAELAKLGITISHDPQNFPTGQPQALASR